MFKAPDNLGDILPALLIRLQVPVAVDVLPGSVASREVTEENVDGNADCGRGRRRVQPQRRQEQQVSWSEESFVGMRAPESGMGEFVEHVDVRAGQSGFDLEVPDVRGREKDKSLRTPNLTVNVRHDLSMLESLVP